MKRTHQHRRGLTLLEVVVAMAIFMISVLAIYQLLTFGRDRALDVQMQTRTSLRCQAKLAEVIVGAVPLQSTGGYSGFDDEKDKDLQWLLTIDELGFDGARQIKVSVKAELPSGRTFETHLAQIILDPEIRGSTLDPPPQASQPGTATKDAAESATPSSTSGTTGTTGGANTGTAPAPAAPSGTTGSTTTPKGS
ncbi:MAG: hypothetical protein EXS16_18735 [Gemmataceae bacterium]|nr:hypothetical protein [Gemmataceae bacterium]